MSQGFQQGLFSYSDGFDGRSTGQHQQSSIHSIVPVNEAEHTAAYDSNTVGTASNMLSDMFNFPTQLTATELLSNQISASYRIQQRPEVITGGYSGDWFAANRLNLHHDQQQNEMIGFGSDSAAAMQLFLSNPIQNHQISHSPSPISPSLHRPQGLSLSLSSTLPQFEMAKGDQEQRDREGILYLNNHSPLQLQGQAQNMAVVNVLSHSKYARAAQELLEEFCTVARGKSKGSKAGKQPGSPSNTVGCDGGASTSAAASSKDMPAPLSAADRSEQQRMKNKLLSMLHEVDRRYNNYSEQMQTVANSFDSVMGFGAAMPYTSLARKAMSRHFRCLKDAIVVHLKKTCELLGDKDGANSSSVVTKGETPRLRILDQSLQHKRAFHQMGMVEQEAWRPQRGLPERSVNILRAWLFEHFLHPYPSDADKHMLARQTGLSRNQVSNWFINARVRLWKPMVEDMYHEEFKDIDSEEREKSSEEAQSPTQHRQKQDNTQAQRPEINPTKHSMTKQSPTLIETDAILSDQNLHVSSGITPLFPATRQSGATGDVSLTLGLRQGPASNAPDKNKFSLREFREL